MSTATKAKTSSKREEIWYVVPEIEVRVHESWVNLIQYCQESLPYGDLRIEIANAQPTRKLKETPSIRFDKQLSGRGDNGKNYLIASLNVYVNENWINLIQWCQNYFTKGKLSFKLHNATPTDLLSAEQEVRFDKPETIPSGMPLQFTKET